MNGAPVTRPPHDALLVVGGGTMGSGIAMVGALAGRRVVVIEPDERAVARARSRIARHAERAGTPEAAERVAFGPSIGEAALTDVVLAIEAVPEDLALKIPLLRDEIEPRLAPDALIATNTSALSVTAMAAALARPERFVGLHFFNPPPVMALVEVVATPTTSPVTVTRAIELVRSLGKTPVVTRDTPGFIVNRVARPYYLHALHALETHLAPPQTIDALAIGIGMPMGPFALMDLIGHDTNAATTASVHERTGAARLRPSALQQELVKRGDLGRKTGRGIYRYDDEGRRVDDDDTGERDWLESPMPEPPSLAAIGEATAPRATAVVGRGRLADAFAATLRESGNRRAVRLDSASEVNERREELRSASVAIDADESIGDERRVLLAALDAALPPDALLLYDAYLTGPDDLDAAVRSSRECVGYGIVGPLERQQIVELARTPTTTQRTLGRATAFFARLGKQSAIIAEGPGLFLGRTIASIINEAAHALGEGVASEADIDTAMQLGTNYPDGPLHWSRAIGRRRVRLILEELARREDPAFAPAPVLRESARRPAAASRNAPAAP